jgi:hypothetical protein
MSTANGVAHGVVAVTGGCDGLYGGPGTLGNGRWHADAVALR